VTNARNYWLENYGTDVSVQAAIDHLGEKQGKGPNFMAWAVRVRPGSKGRDELRNPEYDRFLLANEAALRPFFPDLYERRALLQQMYESSVR
jgi:hypothetical protein